MKRLLLFDTTLRDGEQSPGYGMTSEQKLQLAKQLESLGVDIIEAGFPAASPEDLAGVQNIASQVKGSTIATLARCSDGDIEACARGLEKAAKGRIHIFLSTSDLHLEHKLGIDRKTALEKIFKSTRLARKYSNDVEFSPEDATRTDLDYLIEATQVAVDEGATTINLPDTVGYASPGEYRAMFEAVGARVRGIDKVTLSAHCHNDLGLAVANSLAAGESGAGPGEARRPRLHRLGTHVELGLRPVPPRWRIGPRADRRRSHPGRARHPAAPDPAVRDRARASLGRHRATRDRHRAPHARRPDLRRLRARRWSRRRRLHVHRQHHRAPGPRRRLRASSDLGRT